MFYQILFLFFSFGLFRFLNGQRSGLIRYPSDDHIPNRYPFYPRNQPVRRPEASESEKLEKLLIQASNITSVEGFLHSLGINDIEEPFTNRRRTTYLDQAACEPELRSVELTSPSENRTGPRVFFPKCVRVKRCGGCCTSKRMDCMPSKISQIKVKRKIIELKRSTLTPASETVTVDVHESCKCDCKIKESECDPIKHIYENCGCSCKNVGEQLNCINNPLKFWDAKECRCKCENAYHCSTGLTFSHSTCSCQAK